MTTEQKSVHQSTGYWVTRLARSMERDFEKCLAPLGITRGAYAVLSAVHHEKKSRPAELAAFLGIDGAAVTRHLDRVEKKGLVERALSASDRRSFDINLTAQGRKILKQGQACSRATNENFVANLSEAEIAQLHSLIRKMLAETDNTVSDV